MAWRRINTPGNVKLFESTGRAGGLPILIIEDAEKTGTRIDGPGALLTAVREGRVEVVTLLLAKGPRYRPQAIIRRYGSLGRRQ